MAQRGAVQEMTRGDQKEAGDKMPTARMAGLGVPRAAGDKEQEGNACPAREAGGSPD